jgi:long-chain acyl-CoA synthetase
MLSETGMHSLFQLLLKKERECGDQVYLRQPKQGIWQEFSWSETMSQARKLAAFIRGLGLEKRQNGLLQILVFI